MTLVPEINGSQLLALSDTALLGVLVKLEKSGCFVASGFLQSL